MQKSAKMHLKHLALYPFTPKSHYSSGQHGHEALSGLAYWILIAFDSRQGQSKSLLLAVSQVIYNKTSNHDKALHIVLF